ncbi:MAG: hypothetical protein HY974_02955 [Candidatus Kerfeldbacteria bacterium]|nr:hypothetical protein [Candidatus Kerfeldbacteria bacterium]
MTLPEIKKNIISYAWTPWMERPFRAFILSLFKDGMTRRYMKWAGVNAELKAWLFENHSWQLSQDINKDFADQLRDNLRHGVTIFKVSSSCESFYRENKMRINKLLRARVNSLDKLAELYKILTTITSYIWLAHGFEDIYTEELKRQVPKYVKGDIDKFIGDISFPIKKNKYALFEMALRRNNDLYTILNKYSWMRARDGFSPGFTLQDLKEKREELKRQKNKPIQTRVYVPVPLRPLVKVVQELVYFRTLRTDVLYEFMFLARPVIRAVGDRYNIPFEKLRDCSIHDLLAGNPHFYSSNLTAAAWRGNIAFFSKPILPKMSLTTTKVRGTIAYPGKLRGIVKVVKYVNELDKVKTGDILVTQMTFPSFVIAMKRAAAFVTDEGGITCHASIMAREMKKPCIIGTKVATKVLKDGDLVEVDAKRGEVRLLTKR